MSPLVDAAATIAAREGSDAVYVVADRLGAPGRQAAELAAGISARGLRGVVVAPSEVPAAAQDVREHAALVVDLCPRSCDDPSLLAARLDAPLLAPAQPTDGRATASTRACRAVGLRFGGTEAVALSTAVFTAGGGDDLRLDVDGRPISPRVSQVSIRVHGRLLEVKFLKATRSSYTYVPACRIASLAVRYELSVDGGPPQPLDEPTAIRVWTRTVTAQLVQS